MDKYIGKYLISDNKSLIQINDVCDMLSDTYWAKDRKKDTIESSIDNSLCFGIYLDGRQVGFARCVTDYCVLYYLCDVIIDKNHRGLGLGTQLIKFITEHDVLKTLAGILRTDDAHELYAKFGFEIDSQKSMFKAKKSY